MSEIIQTISRVRRAMPRNKDVMDICDALEKEIQSNSWEGERRAMAALRKETASLANPSPKLSRAEIQRNYRQRQKAKTK